MRVLIRQSGNNHFNTIRLAMALLVIWSHSFAIHLGSERSEWLSLLLGGTLNAGNIGVMAFFVISGFLILQSWERSSSLLSYLNKRVRRIYPGYMIASTISGAVMIWYFHSNATAWSWFKSIALNLLLRNYSPVRDAAGVHEVLAVNGALWSIPYEFWCYLGVAALGLVGLASRRRFLVWSFIAIMALHAAADIMDKKPGLGIIGLIFGWPYLWTRMGPCFLIGMISYCFRDELPRSRAILFGLFLVTVIACRLNEYLGFVVALPSLAYAVFYVAYSKIPLPDAARYGDFSYGTYLYGFLIQMVLQRTIAQNWSLFEFFAVSATLGVTAGAISWYGIEKRFMARKVTTGMASEPAPGLASAW